MRKFLAFITAMIMVMGSGALAADMEMVPVTDPGLLSGFQVGGIEDVLSMNSTNFALLIYVVGNRLEEYDAAYEPQRNAFRIVSKGELPDGKYSFEFEQNERLAVAGYSSETPDTLWLATLNKKDGLYWISAIEASEDVLKTYGAASALTKAEMTKFFEDKSVDHTRIATKRMMDEMK